MMSMWKIGCVPVLVVWHQTTAVSVVELFTTNVSADLVNRLLQYQLCFVVCNIPWWYFCVCFCNCNSTSNSIDCCWASCHSLNEDTEIKNSAHISAPSCQFCLALMSLSNFPFWQWLSLNTRNYLSFPRFFITVDVNIDLLGCNLLLLLTWTTSATERKMPMEKVTSETKLISIFEKYKNKSGLFEILSDEEQGNSSLSETESVVCGNIRSNWSETSQHEVVLSFVKTKKWIETEVI